VEFDVEAPCSASGKRSAVSGKLSISCHPSELQGGAGVVGSMAVSRLSKRPAPGVAATLSARRALLLTSASEALESPSPCRTIGSSTLCQQHWPSISTTEGSGRGSPRLPPELSLCADLLWSTEPPLSSAATSSTPPVLSGP